MTEALTLMDQVADRGGHLCAVRECQVRLRPGVTFCKRHWRMVPPVVARRISRYWREWQVHGSDVAPEEWLRAVHEAVLAVAAVEVATSGG